MPVSRRKQPQYTQCMWCGGKLPEDRRSDMRFCPKGYAPPDLGIDSRHPGDRQTCHDAWHNAEKHRQQPRAVTTMAPISSPDGEDLGDRTAYARGLVVVIDGEKVPGELHVVPTMSDVFGHAMNADPAYDPLSFATGDLPPGVHTKGGPADSTGSYVTFDPTRKQRPVRPLPLTGRGPQYSVHALILRIGQRAARQWYESLPFEEQADLYRESVEVRRLVRSSREEALAFLIGATSTGGSN